MRKSTEFRALLGGSQRQVGSALRSRQSFRRSQKEATNHTTQHQHQNQSPPDFPSLGVTKVDSLDPTSASPPATKTLPVDIWGQAYQKLYHEQKDLVLKYESIITKFAKIDPGLSDLTLNEKAMVIISTELSMINSRQWELQVPWRHEPVLVRRLVEKLAQVAEVFQVPGSAVVTYNPIRVGLPFAGICILIQLITNNSQQHSAALKGLDKVTDIIALYSEVEEAYLRVAESSTRNAFAEKVATLYFHVLEFLFKATCYFDLTTPQRVIRNMPKLDDWDSDLKQISDLDESCRRLAAGLALEDQRRGSKNLVDVLERLQASRQKLEGKDWDTIRRECGSHK